MKSVPITTDIVSLNPIQVRSTRYNISLSVTWDRSVISPGSPVSSTNKTGRHDITEILLKMATTIHSQPWHSRWHIQKRMSLIMADNCSTQPLLLFTSASGDYVILVDLKLKIEMVQPIFVPKPKLKFNLRFYHTLQVKFDLLV